MPKIKSKRSKTRKGEYEVFKGKTKIGEIFKSNTEQGEWAGLLTDKRLASRYSGSSVGGKKWQVIEWFKEWFG
jgi:hypothetical protein